MRFVIATRRLRSPGGAETFVLTLGEALAQLGHEIVLFSNELGLVAEEASRRAFIVLSDLHQLPREIDATISLDRAHAIDLARIYPKAVRLYAMQNTLEQDLPPPEPGIVTATIAPNTRFEILARGCVGAGDVLRIRQPIDILRYSPRGFAKPVPTDVLYVGNYSLAEGQRLTQLQEAWGDFGLKWHYLGRPTPTLDVAKAIAQVDIVVGYGRSILEAMSCGRPAYVHEHSGSDGWVTAANYTKLEANGFAGSALRAHPDMATLRADFANYSPDYGRIGQDLVRMHHDAKMVAADLVQRISALASPSVVYDASALYGLRRLVESHARAEERAEKYRTEAKAAVALWKIVNLPARLMYKAKRRAHMLRRRLLEATNR
ncbi:hypothetical protein [Hyphomicrobium sp. 2TAF46]|uniref:hypothetical protein n=1 Tax=Hyphomicrobium sp. 2TAF46 TaxID=3233019 RepID=UPI003F8DC5E0